jgi:hypothetical protein
MLQVAYRLIDPASEWRLRREWYERSAMVDLLGEGPELAAKDTLYRCLDRLLPHKDALQLYFKERWQDLFGASFDVLLYDLTSTYFESDPPFEEEDKRRFGYSRDHRFDCVPVVIALIVTPEGLPLTYEVLSGNTADATTLPQFLERIEKLYVSTIMFRPNLNQLSTKFRPRFDQKTDFFLLAMSTVGTGLLSRAGTGERESRAVWAGCPLQHDGGDGFARKRPAMLMRLSHRRAAPRA